MVDCGMVTDRIPQNYILTKLVYRNIIHLSTDYTQNEKKLWKTLWTIYVYSSIWCERRDVFTRSLQYPWKYKDMRAKKKKKKKKYEKIYLRKICNRDIFLKKHVLLCHIHIEEKHLVHLSYSCLVLSNPVVILLGIIV